MLERLCNSWEGESKYLDNWFWLGTKIQILCYYPIRIAVRHAVHLRRLTFLCNKCSGHVFNLLMVPTNFVELKGFGGFISSLSFLSCGVSRFGTHFYGTCFRWSSLYIQPLYLTIYNRIFSQCQTCQQTSWWHRTITSSNLALI